MIRLLLLVLFLVMFAGGPFGLHDSVIPGFSIKNLLLYVLFTVIAIQTAVTKNRRLEAISVLTPFGLLIAYCILSFVVVVFVINYPNYGLMEGAFRLKTEMADSFLMLLVFLYGVIKTKDVLWLMRTIIWVFMLANVLTFMDAFELPDIQFIETYRTGRIQGLVGEPNRFGASLAFFLPATVTMLIYENGLKRFLAGIGVIATFVCLLLTFSRGSYAGMILGSIGAAFLLRQHISMRAVTMGTIFSLAACSIAVPFVYFGDYGQVFAERLSLLSGDAHTVSQGRTTLWLKTLSVMLRHPETFLTGYGWNVYATYREFLHVPHNTYLNHLFNIGSVGLALFVTTLAAVLIELRRAVSAMSGFERSLIISTIFGFTALCVSLFFVEIYDAALVLWAYIGLALRLAVASRAREPDE